MLSGFRSAIGPVSPPNISVHRKASAGLCMRKRGKVWYYRYTDADGVKREVKGCADKRVTEELARQAESEAAKFRAGLVDHKELAYRRHAARPLMEHDFHALRCQCATLADQAGGSP